MSMWKWFSDKGQNRLCYASMEDSIPFMELLPFALEMRVRQPQQAPGSAEQSHGPDETVTVWWESRWPSALSQSTPPHDLQSPKSVIPSTTWRHFGSLRKWSDSMLPESLWGLLQNPLHVDPWAFLYLFRMPRSYRGWYRVNGLDRMLVSILWMTFSRWSLLRHDTLNCPYAPSESAPLWGGISGPDLVQSRK